MILHRLKQNKPEAPYSFRERFEGIQRIAIIYPELTKWLRIARYALQNMYNSPEQFEYLLFVPPSSSRPSLNIQSNYANMQYRPNKDESANVLSEIMSFNPDILLQLEPSPNEKLLQLIKTADIPLKMGFGSEDSGLNIIYSQKESGFYEKNILNLIELINTKQ